MKHDTLEACTANRADLARRDMLRALGGAVALSVLPYPATSRAAQSPRTGLGLVIYSLAVRRRVGRGKAPPHDLFEPLAFLEYCRGLGAGGIQVPLGVLEPEACERLRTRADASGMFVEGIVEPPFSDDRLKRFEAEIETAARVGATTVRTVVIPGRRYEQFKSLEEFERSAARGRRALERAAPIVERHRVRLAVENHKDHRIEERLALFRHLDSDSIGACVDIGNSLALLEDPVAVVEALAPHAFSVHLKDQAAYEYESGFLLADVGLGEGFLDLKRMVALLRRAQPGIRFTLETITRDPLPVPCLSEAYWLSFPPIPASDLARTLRLVRMHASAKPPDVGSLPLEKQAEVELATVRRCLEYARTELGL